MTTVATSTLESIESLTNVVDLSKLPSNSRLRDLQFELTHKLQSSLEIQSTLQEFFNKIGSIIHLDGLAYQQPGKENVFILGEATVHKACYAIHVESENLGSVTFHRVKPFLEAELAILEMMIGTLCYPLRNAFLYQQAIQNSYSDALTGIGNRAAMVASLDRELKLFQRHQQCFSILIIDIDFFKKINDTYGHTTGDTVLRAVAKELQQELRETDLIFRFGGEEFVAILTNTPIANAQITAHRLRKRIASARLIDKADSKITISIGVSESHHEDSLESLFERADNALYKAKHNGRNCVEFSLLDGENHQTGRVLSP